MERLTWRNHKAVVLSEVWGELRWRQGAICHHSAEQELVDSAPERGLLNHVCNEKATTRRSSVNRLGDEQKSQGFIPILPYRKSFDSPMHNMHVVVMRWKDGEGQMPLFVICKERLAYLTALIILFTRFQLYSSCESRRYSGYVLTRRGRQMLFGSPSLLWTSSRASPDALQKHS